MKKRLKTFGMICSIIVVFAGCEKKDIRLSPSPHDLVFSSLATRRDEAIPLSNAIVGSFVRQKDGALRMSLDRAGWWDLRPMVNGDSLSKYNRCKAGVLLLTRRSPETAPSKSKSKIELCNKGGRATFRLHNACYVGRMPTIIHGEKCDII
jgi:hypothetical protein